MTGKAMYPELGQKLTAFQREALNEYLKEYPDECFPGMVLTVELCVKAIDWFNTPPVLMTGRPEEAPLNDLERSRAVRKRLAWAHVDKVVSIATGLAYESDERLLELGVACVETWRLFCEADQKYRRLAEEVR